jgi:transposase InsO family protein
MLGNGHVRFGGRAAETDQSKDRHRAAARPHTEHPTGEGKLYLCAVKDACSKRIVGYSIAARMTAELAAPSTRSSIPTGQFRSHVFVQALREAGLVGSMGRVGACADCETGSCHQAA